METIMAQDAELKKQIKEAVASVVSEKIFQVTEASKKKLTKEEMNAKSEEGEGSDEGEEGEDEEGESESDEESDSKSEEDKDKGINESIEVTASPSKKGKDEKLKLANMRELTKLAKTGKYNYFVVKSNKGFGDTDYSVERGKLLEM
jgi:hypothetical protein